MKTRESVLPIVVAFLLIRLVTPFAFADHNININTADKGALMTLTGIGEVKAQAIIDYRNAHGSFQKKEDVMNVKGIGEATYNTIKDHITLEGGASVSPTPPPTSTPSASPVPTPQGTPSSYVAPPEKTIFADAGEDRIVVVGADVEYSGHAYNKKNEPVTGLIRYSWNFGDGSAAEGRSVLHRFAYPGRYAVVLQIAQETESASDTIVAEANPAQLRLLVLSDGALAIENVGDSDLDLSRWILSAGGSTFALQNGTVILKGATVPFSPQTTGLRADGEILLLYPNGSLAFRAELGAARSTIAPPSPPSPQSVSLPQATAQSDSQLDSVLRKVSMVSADEDERERESEKSHDDRVGVATTSQVAASGNAMFGSWVWWLGAFGMITLAAGALIVARRFGKYEWKIIEEKPEGE